MIESFFSGLAQKHVSEVCVNESHIFLCYMLLSLKPQTLNSLLLQTQNQKNE